MWADYIKNNLAFIIKILSLDLEIKGNKLFLSNMYKLISIITFIYSCTIISNGLQIVHKSHIYRSLPLLNGVVNKGPSIFDDDNQIDDEDDYVKYYPNEPTWSKMFPSNKKSKPEITRDAPNFEELKPNDPLFLDMGWPSEKGPEASAYARHLQWKRSLTDSERVSWQKWAIYKRIMMKDKFDYSVEDYVFQNIINICNKRARLAKLNSNKVKESVWSSIATGYKLEEETEVTALVKSLYSAFNRKNFNELRTLWLPDDSAQLSLPGYSIAKGHEDIDQLYRKVIAESKPFGSITENVLKVNVVGYIAVAYVLETVERGSALKVIKGKTRTNQASDKSRQANIPTKRVLSVLVLRKWNKQWRIFQQYSNKISKLSSFDETTYKKSNNLTSKTDRLKSKDNIALAPESTLEEFKEASTSNRINKYDDSDKFKSASSRIGYSSKSKEDITVQLSGQGSKPSVNNINPIVPKINDNSVNSKGVLKFGNDGSFYVSKATNQKENNSKLSSNKTKNNKSTSVSNLNEGGRSKSGKPIVAKQSSSSSSSSKGSSLNSSNKDLDAAEMTISRLTVKVLRTLEKVGSITKEQKKILLAIMIQNFDIDKGKSPVETALDLLVLRAQSEKDENALENFEFDDLDEFSEHCISLCESEKRGDSSSNSTDEGNGDGGSGYPESSSVNNSGGEIIEIDDFEGGSDNRAEQLK